MKQARQSYGRIWRELPSPDECLTTTVYGKLTPLMFRCKTCKKIFYASEAFMKSHRDRNKTKGALSNIRPQCVACYTDTNGKVLPKDTEPRATLDNFMGIKMNVDQLAKTLSDSVYHIEFNKSDGTLRKMRATRMSTFIPKDKQPKSENHKLTTAVPVFDLDIQEWRSVKPENIIKLEPVL